MSCIKTRTLQTNKNNKSTIIKVRVYCKYSKCKAYKIQQQLFLFHCRRYDDDDDRVWDCGAWFEYILVVVVSSILLIAASILTIFWVIFYRKGFSMDDPKLQFNLHPVLMVGGYITLSGFCKLSIFSICFLLINNFFLFICSHFIVLYLPLLFTLNSQAVSYIFSCLFYSMYHHRFLNRMGFSQSDSNAQFLLVALLAWLHYHGTFCSTVYLGIFQVYYDKL